MTKRCKKLQRVKNGEDYYGPFKLKGISKLVDDNWKLEFELEWEQDHSPENPKLVQYNCTMDERKMKGYCGDTVDNTVETEMSIWIEPCAFK